MTMIRQPWTRQPQGVVRVAPAYTPGLSVLWVGSAGSIKVGTNANAAILGVNYGLDPGSISTIVPAVPSRSGMGLTVPASGSPPGFFLPRASSANDAQLDIPDGSDYTWLISVDVSAYGAGNPAIFRAGNTGSGSSFVFLSTTQIWVRHNGSDFTASITGPAAGTTANVCVSVRSGVSVRAWVNGRLAINATTATATANLTGTSAVSVFGRNGSTASNERVAGNYTLIGLWHAARSDGAALTTNPWQLFAPIERRIWVPSAGGGASVISSAAGIATSSALAGSSVAASNITSATGAATASALAGASVATAAFGAAAGAATASTLAGVAGAGSTVSAAAGVATTSALAGSSVAVAAFSAAAGASTASAATGSSVAVATFGAAAGAATTATLNSAVGASAITPASGLASASVIAGSSIVVSAFSPAAGVATTSTLANAGATIIPTMPPYIAVYMWRRTA